MFTLQGFIGFHLHFLFHLADVCLTYENESAMKKEMTKWTKGRDIWWQVSNT